MKFGKIMKLHLKPKNKILTLSVNYKIYPFEKT